MMLGCWGCQKDIDIDIVSDRASTEALIGCGITVRPPINEATDGDGGTTMDPNGRLSASARGRLQACYCLIMMSSMRPSFFLRLFSKQQGIHQMH
jgi:hypothetical protein